MDVLRPTVENALRSSIYLIDPGVQQRHPGVARGGTMEKIEMTLGEILLFDKKLPAGVYILWNNELEEPVYIGNTVIGCDLRIIEHWKGGPFADLGLNAAMHHAEPYCLDWTVEVYAAAERDSSELERNLRGKLSPQIH